MRRLTIAAVIVPLLAAATAPAATAPAATAPAATAPAVEATRVDTDRLDLGPADLPEQRTTETVQPGVTLTRIVRGEPDPALFWTVEVSIPGGPGSPDPDAPPTALKDRVSAEETATELAADGFDARVEQVTTPAVTDFAGGELGWRVRVAELADRTAALAERGRLVAAGYAGSAVFTGWDSEPTDRGPWRVDVLTIDPRQFRGTLDMSYGPDLEQRETTSLLADAAGAVAGVNAGFFVLDPNAGAPGDPAGVSVDDGTLLSEPINGRPVLVLRDDARHSEVVRLTWTGEVVTASGDPMPLDGLNRVPGKIRNCGGTADDLPTSAPLHDVTCTDADELVAFTTAYGARTPAGEGAEAVLDADGVVTAVRSPRGGPLPSGGSSVQATGTTVNDLRDRVDVGDRLQVLTGLVDKDGRAVRPSKRTSVVNGGPELVRDGRLEVTPATDGMLHPDNPSFYYGWAHKRNPRTIAGTDPKGRLVLVTADGRSADSLGLSILETATVARSLGLRDAINLDGGGSTTMVVDGAVINEPSDGTERPVGDALLVLPAG